MKAKEIVCLVMKAVALGMGVCVIVLSILTELSVDAGMTMLGIGLACLAIVSLMKTDKNKQ